MHFEQYFQEISTQLSLSINKRYSVSFCRNISRNTVRQREASTDLFLRKNKVEVITRGLCRKTQITKEHSLSLSPCLWRMQHVQRIFPSAEATLYVKNSKRSGRYGDFNQNISANFCESDTANKISNYRSRHTWFTVNTSACNIRVFRIPWKSLSGKK